MKKELKKETAAMARDIGRTFNPLKNPLTESILLSALWLSVLVLAIFMSSSITDKTAAVSHLTTVYYGVIFFLYTAAYLYDIIRFRRRSKGRLVQSIFSVLIPAVLGFLAFFMGTNEVVFMAVTIVFYSMLIVRHIVAIIFGHNMRKGIWNFLLIILWAACIIYCAESWKTPSNIATIVAITHLVLAIIMVATSAFKRLQLEVLIRIARKTFAAEIFIGLISLIIAFSIVFYHVEDQFTNIGDALWYCFAIVTTIGFGDFATKTLITRLLSVILGIYGLIAVAVITSIIVNFYNETRLPPEAPAEESEPKKSSTKKKKNKDED